MLGGGLFVLLALGALAAGDGVSGTVRGVLAIPPDAGPDRLPREGRYEGTVLLVTVADGEFVGADHREGESKGRRKALKERFDQLSDR